MVFEYIKEGRLAIFTIDGPEVNNALNVEVAQELRKTMMGFLDDPDLLVGIITGAGDKAFCVGADIGDMLTINKCISSA